MMSKEELIKKSRENNYKPENLEKVYKLLLVLEQLLNVPYLKKRLVLKGGTAINLFHFEPVPRLSVDIDLNYIGQIERKKMLEERVLIGNAINQILLQSQFAPHRSPTQHAGGKSIWRYDSALGQKGNLEIDLNYMFRKPLWPIKQLEPKILLTSSFKVPTLDIHELASGKLAALFSRRVSRDFFDAHQLLAKCELDRAKLKVTFIIYAAMSDASIEDIGIDCINYDLTDIKNKLLPVLRQDDFPRKKELISRWANTMLEELRDQLSLFLPFKENELGFIKLLREKGEVKPELITSEQHLIEAVMIHPLIKWKAMQAKAR